MRFLEEALQIFERKRPAIALILDIRLQQSDRGRSAVAREVFDIPRQRHAVRELCHLGQIATDLQFGIRMGLETSISLQEQAFAKTDYGVAALRVRAIKR